MEKENLLFYDAYQEFYEMAKTSKAFQLFCKDAFGEDFSQDGFSDQRQIDRILEYIPKGGETHILDVGCGNGKMAGYLQSKTGAYIHGFDYSSNAIDTAKQLFTTQADFREGLIGEIEYEKDQFDLITSMDTMYFADDMVKFVGQVKNWLKKDGVFFVGYQEGDVIPKTENVMTTQIVHAFQENNMKYEYIDITKETYELLLKKREAAFAHKDDFVQEGYQEWYEMLIFQTEDVMDGYDSFCEKMSRYIFVARK